MDAESMYTRAEAIFLEAVAVAAGPERTRLLEEACGGDAALRTWVEDLLRYDGDLADEFDQAIQSVASAMACDVLPRDEDWLGRTLGAYRIKAKIGAGGMGSVFLGERADERFQRQVAIKLVHPSMGEVVRLRLLEERRILARLEHPNIARLLDAGETPEGVPYLVMEYLPGMPIQHYCREKKCGRREVCRLILQVCEAVAYAHRHLVIHRDLKPPNILVGEDGVPKLLDFGIAALLGTEPGERAYTPRYASPEVMHGKPVDTSADVFSLGVLLRELLGTELDPDLACVVAKATADTAGRRYLTAEELARELRAYLEGFPVSAREDSWIYAAKKFVRRNRLAVTAALIAAGLLLLTTCIAVLQARRADAARRDAQARLEEMVGLANRTVTSIDATLERIPGTLEGRRAIVEETIAFLDRARQTAGGDPALLRTVATGYLRMALVMGGASRPNLGMAEEGERHLAAAEALFTSLLRRDPANAELQTRWLETRRERAGWTYNRSTPQDAIAIFKESLAEAKRWRMAGRRPLSFLLEEAQLHTQYAHALAREKPAEGVREANEAIALLEPMLPANAANPEALDTLAEAYSRRSEGEMSVEGPRAVVRTLEIAAGLRERLLALRPGDTVVQRNLLILSSKLVIVTALDVYGRSLGDVAAAERHAARMLELAEHLKRADAADENAQFDYAKALLTAGLIPSNRPLRVERLRGAKAEFEKLIARKPLARYERELAMALEFLGRRLAEDGDALQGVRHLERSLAISARLLQREPGDRRNLSQWVSTAAGLLPVGAKVWPREKSERMERQMLAVAMAHPEYVSGMPRMATARGQMWLALAERGRACAMYRLAKAGWVKAGKTAAEYQMEFAQTEQLGRSCR